jgi:type I restriction enzyme S subunit
MEKVKFRWLVREVDVRNSIGLDYPLMSVSQTRGVISRSELMGNEGRAESLDNYKVCKPGQIVINRMSAPSGALGLAKQSGLVSPDYAVLAPTELIDPKYLEYVMSSKWFIGEMIARLKGIGAGGESSSVRTPRINISDLKDVAVPLPTMGEQRRIAGYLEKQVATVDELISAKSKVQKLLYRALQAEFTNIFGNPFFSDEEKFASRRLGPCLLANDGGVWGDDPTGSGDSLVLRSTEISQRGFWRELGNAAYRKLEEREARDSRLRVGDIVVTKASGSPDHIGKAAITTQEVADLNASFGNFMQRLRVDSTVYLPEYLYYFLKSSNARSQFNFLGTTSTGLMNISAEVLSNLRLPIVTTEAQQIEISNLREIEKRFENKLDLVERSIATCNEYKSSLVTAAILGSFDVTTGRSIQ